MIPQKIHVCIDIETLDTTPHAVVLSAAANILLESEDGTTQVVDDVFEMNFNLEEQPDRSISREVLRFWASMPPGVFDKALPAEPVVPEHFPLKLHTWIYETVMQEHYPDPSTVPESEWDAILYWGDPSHFDMGVLNSYCLDAGIVPPWKHFQVRCINSAQEMFGIVSIQPLIPHDPASDVRAATKTLQNVLDAKRTWGRQALLTAAVFGEGI